VSRFLSMLLLALLASSHAAACSCVISPPPREALKGADAVFVGKVVGGLTTSPSSRGVLTHFLVRSAWKGCWTSAVAVDGTAGGSNCGYSFEMGEEYLIYARRRDGELYTSQCTRTAPAREAMEDLAALGLPPLTAAVAWLTAVLATVGIALIVGAWRKRRADTRR
jgi:hypothetical protein